MPFLPHSTVELGKCTLLPGVLAEVFNPPLGKKLPAGLVSTPFGVAWKKTPRAGVQ